MEKIISIACQFAQVSITSELPFETQRNHIQVKFGQWSLRRLSGRKQLFDLKENLLTGSYTRTDKGEIAANLEKVYNYFPRLKTRRTSQAAYTSGGEQQMLTIGRALMGNPSLLLLDEPSEGLAPIMVQKIGELIENLRQLGTTIVLAEQNLHFCLGLADRAVVIDKGSDVFVGSIAELNANADIKKRYLSV